MDGGEVSQTAVLRASPLDDKHRALGARLVPFAGWSLPLQFQGIVQEHNAVRTTAGVFDVSHMGRLYVSGRDAAGLLRRALTYDVRRLAPGQGHYALLCREDGGILDDPYVYRLAEDRFLLVGNAVNVERDRGHVEGLVSAGAEVHVEDRQSETVMLALQGPNAPAHLSRALGESAPDLPRRRCSETPWGGGSVFVSRTGYTGEDGFELVASVAAGRELWQRLIEGGVRPCGLGARDSLRLEAALPLYGSDIDESTNPWEAGLTWAVTLDDGDEFVGREALLDARGRLERRLTCLKAEEPGVIRAGYAILHGVEPVARVSSGGYSPTLQLSIAMGYLPPALAAEGTKLEVDVRGKGIAAIVVPRPFYRRPKA